MNCDDVLATIQTNHRCPSLDEGFGIPVLEAMAFALLLVFAGDIVFSTGFGRTFVMVPFVIWAAFRFGQREVTTTSAVICAMALGYTLDTPLAAWYTHIRSQRLVDGPDEVHRWTTGRNVIKAYKQFGTTASAAGGDLL